MVGEEEQKTSSWKTIVVTTNSTTTKYSTVAKINTEGTNEAYVMNPKDVSMTMRTRNYYTNSTYFNGSWYVSESVYNKLNRK